MNARSFMIVGLVTSCTPAGGVVLHVADDAVVRWSDRYDGLGDGLGALVPLDVLVFDPAMGTALPGVDVSLWLEGSAPMAQVGLVVASAVERGAVACEDCGWDGRWDGRWDVVWDVWSDDRVGLRAEPGGSASWVTDERGLARGYVWVDRMGDGDGGRAQTVVRLSAAGVDATFTVRAR